jgi:hypothetical protein
VTCTKAAVELWQADVRTYPFYAARVWHGESPVDWRHEAVRFVLKDRASVDGLAGVFATDALQGGVLHVRLMSLDALFGLLTQHAPSVTFAPASRDERRDAIISFLGGRWSLQAFGRRREWLQ